MGFDPLLRVSNRLRQPIAIPCAMDFGTWDLTTWDNGGTLQHGALLTPNGAPWRRLFRALDEAGADLSSDPLTALDEADAIVASCWLFGSYAYTLTCGELYPPFRDDPTLSRISDIEMKRINIEFTSGLATWWDDRASERGRVSRRTRAALQLLPMPWRDRRKAADFDQRFVASAGADLISRLHAISDRLEVASNESEETSNRRVANWLVENAYRNGPVESVHAGSWSHGCAVPGFVRLYASDIERIAAKTSWRLALYVAAGTHPIGLTLLRAAARLSGPSHWSLREETAQVEFLGLPGMESLESRLRWLSDRLPTVYEYGPRRVS